MAGRGPGPVLDHCSPAGWPMCCAAPLLTSPPFSALLQNIGNYNAGDGNVGDHNDGGLAWACVRRSSKQNGACTSCTRFACSRGDGCAACCSMRWGFTFDMLVTDNQHACRLAPPGNSNVGNYNYAGSFGNVGNANK